MSKLNIFGEKVFNQHVWILCNCYEALIFACGTFMQRTENFHHQVKAVGWGRNVNKKR